MKKETKKIKEIEKDIAHKQGVIHRLYQNVGIGYMNRATRNYINKKKREIASLNKQIDTLLEKKKRR